MANKLSINPVLVELPLELSGRATTEAAVTKALQEIIVHRRQRRVLDLLGKLDWQPSYDYKAERSRK